MDSTKIKRLVNARDALNSKLDDQLIILHDLVTRQRRHTKVNRLIGECTNIHFEIVDKNEQLSHCETMKALGQKPWTMRLALARNI